MIERKVPCPRCKKLIVYSKENKFRPFCSERCKLIDLGDWASEAFRIPINTSENENSQTDASGNSLENESNQEIHED
ncbi:MAG: DNA gyrase inhibitor YacG [Bdellovibrionaceae bacterium]|nr:DNA gyrase inhibitor YacG [Pseudobdellovibrionaceae bacterium]NUM60250.1 DNA gyrase inhibitor YacG [Pseudobdellovibrionaceae bacterium]